ncbi:hypothetical protein V8F20_000052 [Naviculisporaceae sp. PSN 640]
MADPRYRYPAGTRRQSPPLYNPARASMPVTSADSDYDALYAGDLHGMSSSHHGALVSRPAGDYEYDYRSSAVPVSSTTYAVRKDPIPRSTSVKESGSRSHRSSTSDGASKRPIIITTKHGAGAEATTSRTESPTRDGYRMADDTQYYAEPASSINRARSTTRAPMSAALDNDEYRRLRERTEMLGPRAANDSYRPSRPSVVYSTTPHRGDTREYDDDGYEYTRPSDLARYDLDHHHQPRRSRRDSQERYYRPTVSVATGLTHPYEPNDRRQRGPPPTTWGLDKINRIPAAGIYDGGGIRMPVPPAVPLAPDPSRRGGLLDVAGSPPTDRRTTSRQRPVSLIHDAPSRSSRADDDYYRPRDDDILHRSHEYITDDNVATRGFGIRVEPDLPPKIDDRRRATEPLHRDDRRDDRGERWNLPREYDDYDIQRSDEDQEYLKRKERDDRGHRSHHELARDRKDKVKESSPVDDDRDDKKDKLRDKVVAGLGVAAASLGLGSVLLDKDDKDKDKEKDKAEKRADAEADRSKLEPEIRSKHRRRDSPSSDEDFEIIDLPKKEPKDRDKDSKDASADKEDEHRRPKEEPKLSADATSSRRDPSQSTDDGKADDKGEERSSRRRKRAPSAFNPNDTATLAAIKAQLAASEDTKKPETEEKPIPTIKEPSSPERETSPGKIEADLDSETGVMVVRERDDSRGRELALPEKEERQVRVVSPPREKEEKKPIKGILKQPKPQFPEEPNPIREGVAPHKDDKTKADVPSGARWTKINRKLVNPEALTIGKERFEVRDDFVIVLRVLSKEEIQAYADATQVLRGGLQHFLFSK